MTLQEKIRQFVIMARHPEAKSYEEALSMETEYKDNLYEWFYINTKGKRITQISNKVPSYNKGFQNLGRPITALDVCWALQKQDKYMEYRYDINTYGIHIANAFDKIDIIFPTIKPDGTHTTLQEWSDEVCENIVRYFENN